MALTRVLAQSTTTYTYNETFVQTLIETIPLATMPLATATPINNTILLDLGIVVIAILVAYLLMRRVGKK